MKHQTTKVDNLRDILKEANQFEHYDDFNTYKNNKDFAESIKFLQIEE